MNCQSKTGLSVISILRHENGVDKLQNFHVGIINYGVFIFTLLMLTAAYKAIFSRYIADISEPFFVIAVVLVLLYLPAF